MNNPPKMVHRSTEVGKNEQRFYVHEALAIKKDELLFKTGAASNSSGVPGSNSSAIYSLLQKVINNNSRQEKNATSTYSISEDSQTIDKKYQKAVDSGNMQLAQKLVEKRAKQNGYELFGYHGTEEGGFTEFDAKYSDDGISLFIAKNKETAQSYIEDYSVE